MSVFDETWLDDRQVLTAADPVLRRLAEAGARLRRESEEAIEPIRGLTDLARPRAVIAVGPEARFIRCMLEPVCPVPFVAWPAAGLPGWVGALDLVVVLASAGTSPDQVASVHEAVRRGSQVLIACPEGSTIAEHAASRSTTLLPTTTADPLAAAVVVLAGLHQLQLGPEVRPELVADAMDVVAEDCSPFADLSQNPAKDLAMCLADAQPLVWGGTVVAARASRRLAEALRAASGRAALAAEAHDLVPVLDAAAPRDPFADPFEDVLPSDRRPSLVVLDDGKADALARAAQTRLKAAAERNDVRVCMVAHRTGSDVERYATLLHTGMYAAVYFAVGLGRYLDP